MTKTYFFLSGLPRSGQTLLSTILNQNPDIHSGPESPLCRIITNCLLDLQNSEQHILYPKKKISKSISLGLANAYYEDVNSSYIIDKCRVWNKLENIKFIAENLNSNVKIICCVRNIIEVLSSFIFLIKNSPSKSYIDENLEFEKKSITDDNRCEWLMKKNGLIDLSLQAISESYFLPEIHLIEYNDLIRNPKDIINSVYDFLEIKKYPHKFKNLSNNLCPNDNLLGLPNLHYVYDTIKKFSPDPNEVLSDAIIKKYSNMEIWR